MKEFFIEYNETYDIKELSVKHLIQKMHTHLDTNFLAMQEKIKYQELL